MKLPLIIRLAVACALLLGLSVSPACAGQEGDFIYQLDPAGASVTGYTGSRPDVDVPDTLGGQPVTKIGTQAFEGQTLTRITLPASLTEIGTHSFFGCTRLTNISIPDGVIGIGYSAFQGCTNLRSVSIPNKVTGVGGFVFFGCIGLTNISLPSSVTNIGEYAFAGCTALTTVTIPKSVAFIGDRVFAGCTSLTAIEVDTLNSAYGSFGGVFYDKKRTTLLRCPVGKAGALIIPDGITTIHWDAFQGCASLTSVTIPTSTVTIRGYAFKDCTSLKSITIPASVTYLAYGVFYNCTGLTSITIPNSVTGIGERAFQGCARLTTITIPDSVTIIERDAFAGCTGLTAVTIPSSVYFMGPSVFSYCNSLTTIEVAPLSQDYSSLGGVLYNKNRTLLIECPPGKAGDFTIPDNVITIKREAFSGCKNLTSVSIPDGVTVIESSAFQICTGLTNITIPDSVTSIGNGAFLGCTRLTAIAIPDGVTVIESAAFQRCTSLTNITIPNTATSIGERVFLGCTSLADITIPGSITSIGDGAFLGCTRLTAVTIPNGVKSIGREAFFGCVSLIGIEVAPLNSVYSSLEGVLYDKNQTMLFTCPSGKAGAVVIPNGVTTVFEGAFDGCASLASVSIPDSVTTIGWKAFSGCTKLTTVTIPGRADCIGSEAFSGCTSLAALFFEGPPPLNCSSSTGLGPLPLTTIYHRAEVAGWGSTFAGLPTATWVPLPVYGPWAVATGLTGSHPEASEPSDDPDGDGFTNLEELQIATDPTDAQSRLVIELAARPDELSDVDKVPVPDTQAAVFFRSTPGKTYGLVILHALGGTGWPQSDGTPGPSQPILVSVVTATHPQTRVLVTKPQTSVFYQVFALAEQGIALAPAPTL